MYAAVRVSADYMHGPGGAGLGVRVASPAAAAAALQDVDWLPTTDLAELFSKLGLGKYTYLFQEQEVRAASHVDNVCADTSVPVYDVHVHVFVVIFSEHRCACIVHVCTYT